MGESFKKHEQNSLIVTYQQGTSQKVRGQANSLPGPLLRRTKKKKKMFNFVIGAGKKKGFILKKNTDVSQDRWHGGQKSKTSRSLRFEARETLELKKKGAVNFCKF